MDGFDPRTVQSFVEFLYTGDYTDPGAVDEEGALKSEQSGSSVDGVERGILCILAIFISWSANKEEAEEEEETDIQPNGPTHGGRGPVNSTAPHAILNHIFISSIAHVYKVDKLTQLANRRVETIVDDESSDKSWLKTLPAAAKATLERPVDGALRDIIATAVARNLAPIVQSPGFESLKTAPDFLMAVLRRCAWRFLALETAQGACKTEVDSLRARLDASEAYAKAIREKLDQEERKDAKARAASAEANGRAGDLQARLDKMEKMVKILDVTQECRNCGVYFACYIDEEKWVLRCEECLCKHSP